MPTRRHDKRPRLFWHKQRDQWVIIYWHPRTKRRTWKQTFTADRTAAEEALIQFSDRLGASRLGLLDWPKTSGTGLMVSTCIDYVLGVYQRPGYRSSRSTLSAAKLAKQVLGNARADTLTELQVLDAQDHLYKVMGYAPNYINRILQIVQHGLRLAYRYEQLPAMPRWPWPRFDPEDSKREQYVTADELAQANAHEPEAAVRDLNTFAFLTGMRLNELRRILWTSFDRATWTLHLPRRLSKNKKPRPLMIPEDAPELREILTRRLQAEEGPLIFHLDGLPIGNGRWGRAWKRAGLEMRTTKKGHLAPVKVFHDMRRSGVRNLSLAGVQTKHGMLVSGHLTRKIFDDYNPIEAREIAASLAKVSEYVGRLPTLPPEPPSIHAVQAARQRQIRRHGGRVRRSARGDTPPGPASTPAPSGPSAP